MTVRRMLARDLRPGDIVHFGDRRETVSAIATQVSTFFNPGGGIPHGCLSLYWEGEDNSFPVAPKHEFLVSRGRA